MPGELWWRAGGGGPSRSAVRGWSCSCHRRERAEGVRDELVGTQRALDAARVQATAAGSALRSAKDAIRAAESRAKEVRGTGAAGAGTMPPAWPGSGVMLGPCWGQQGQCCGSTGNNGVGAMGALGGME